VLRHSRQQTKRSYYFPYTLNTYFRDIWGGRRRWYKSLCTILSTTEGVGWNVQNVVQYSAVPQIPRRHHRPRDPVQAKSSVGRARVHTHQLAIRAPVARLSIVGRRNGSCAHRREVSNKLLPAQNSRLTLDEDETRRDHGTSHRLGKPSRRFTNRNWNRLICTYNTSRASPRSVGPSGENAPRAHSHWHTRARTNE